MKTQDSNIVDKIKKLLALAGNNPNEAEAALAAEKAQALMLKHGIEAQALDAKEGAPDVKVGEQDVERNRKLVVWKALLLQAIAKSSFCEVFTVGGRVMLVGKEHNRQGVKVVYDYLVDSIESIVRGEIGRGAPAKAHTSPREFGWNFRRGCVARLSQRFRELRARQEREGLDASCTAIVVANAHEIEKKAIKAYYDSVGIKFGKARSASSNIGGGFMEGMKAGDSISLTPQGKLGKGAKALA